MNRDLLITLVFSGSSPDLAYLSNRKYTLEEYIAAADTEEYKIFAAAINKSFIENADLRLLGQLYKIDEALLELTPDHRNYPSLLKNYHDLLKLTAPIVERMQKHRVEINAFDGLELIIRGTNTNE